MANSVFSDKLWIKIIVGMILGIAVGLLIAPTGLSLLSESVFKGVMPWLALPGDIFITLLKMVIVPLVLSSVILGVAAADTVDTLKLMGKRIVPYFVITTGIAIAIGIAIVSIIRPGDSMNPDTAVYELPEVPMEFGDLTIPDRILNMLPANPAETILVNDMLQLVVMAIIIGIAVIVVQHKSVKTFRDLCEFVQEACMMVVGWAMRIAPVAVFSLMIVAMASLGTDALSGMGLYVLSILLGLSAIMVVYLLIVVILARRNPIQFLKDIRAAQIVAFSTSSSAATIPVSLNVSKEKLKANEDVSDFVIPLGAAINMEGTALYQAVAAIFLCQAFGIDLTMGETVLLLFTTIGASIGTPAMPGVGIVVLATILSGLGVPPEGIGIILGVDRILDMCRTTINVTGDLTAVVVMQRWMHGDNIPDVKTKKTQAA